MKNLLPFLLSLLLPGAGQLYLKQTWKGLLMIGLVILPWIFIPFLIFQFYHLVLVIWSVADVYFTLEKTEGRDKAVRRLVFSVIIAALILPAIFYASIIGLFSGALLLSETTISTDYTKDEMTEISEALEKHLSHYNSYPSDYADFVGKKPIWSSWKEDQWGNAYRYVSSDSVSYQLISSGEDEVFDTEDDIVRHSGN